MRCLMPGGMALAMALVLQDSSTAAKESEPSSALLSVSRELTERVPAATACHVIDERPCAPQLAGKPIPIILNIYRENRTLRQLRFVPEGTVSAACPRRRATFRPISEEELSRFGKSEETLNAISVSIDNDESTISVSAAWVSYSRGKMQNVLCGSAEASCRRTRGNWRCARLVDEAKDK